jgi:large subunit ribosomal protein L16
MGKGKGAPEFWVAVVKPGRVMFELAGLTEAESRESLRLAASKLSVGTQILKREEFGYEAG